jgi:hypothetical protein
MISRVPADIRSENRPNKYLELHCYARLPGHSLWFVLYLTTPSIPQIIHRRLEGRLVNKELQCIWKCDILCWHLAQGTNEHS